MEFKKDEYIVVLNTPENEENFPRNYIFKQRNYGFYLSVYKDNKQSGNGWVLIDYRGEKEYGKWRYATEQEIAEYDRRGAPFDTTTLTPEPIDLTSLLNLYKKLNIT